MYWRGAADYVSAQKTTSEVFRSLCPNKTHWLKAEQAGDYNTQEIAAERGGCPHHDDLERAAEEVEVRQPPLDDAEDDERDNGEQNRDSQRLRDWRQEEVGDQREERADEIGRAH